jgi:hypothetical protein
VRDIRSHIKGDLHVSSYTESKEAEKIEYAAMMLAEYLASGPKPYDEVKEYCAKWGITKTELKAARKELNVKTINTGSTWLWYVPDPGDEVNG